MKLKKREKGKKVITRRNLVPYYDAQTLTAWFADLSRKGLHFTGFAKHGRLNFEQGNQEDRRYKIVFVSEIKEKSTGEYLSQCQDSGLRFIDRLDEKDLFVFQCVGENVDMDTEKRAKFRSMKMLATYLGIFLATVLLALGGGIWVWFGSVRRFGHDALTYYSGSFWTFGIKIMFFGLVLLVLCAGVLLGRYLTRNKKHEQPQSAGSGFAAVGRWVKLFRCCAFSVAVVMLGLLIGLFSVIGHARDRYTASDIPAGAHNIDFSEAGDNTTLLECRYENTSILMDQHFKITWEGNETSGDNKVVEKKYTEVISKCLTTGIAKRLYRHYALPQTDGGTWKVLDEAQCREMDVDAGKYCKSGQYWYLLIRQENRVWLIDTYNMYCNEEIGDTLTQIISVGKN